MDMNMKLSKLFTEEKIKERTKEIADSLTERLKGKDVVAIGILNGSFMFFSDVTRQMDLDISCEFMGISTYGANTTSSGDAKITLDLMNSVKGKDVLIVEDIVDTGYTMEFLMKNLESRGPKSVTTTTLLFKPEALKAKVEIDFVGFEISNEFVVGYGLDYQGYYRNLPYIARIENIN